jgi:hypothetical protein
MLIDAFFAASTSASRMSGVSSNAFAAGKSGLWPSSRIDSSTNPPATT